jgi:hypothetical protein
MGDADRGGGGKRALAKAAARVGLVASAFAVFASGYLAMQSSDWKRIALFTLVAAVAGLLAQAFSRRAR